MPKGPLKQEEKDLILKKTGNWSLEEIAEELDRKPETIQKFLGQEKTRVFEEAVPETGGAVMTKALSEKGDDISKKTNSKKYERISSKSGRFIMDKNKQTR